MDETEIQLARARFRARIDSLRNDIMRCFWPITNVWTPDNAPSPVIICGPPQYALFPALMYCFATVDYCSGFWEGWNKDKPKGSDRNQSKRMTDFLCKFLRYPRKEAFLAINVWRHKLMHTSEPRIVRSKEPRVYLWAAGVGGSYRVGEVEAHHMRLEKLPPTSKDPNRSLLYFDCWEFVHDMEEGVFGPTGYFPALLRNDNYECPSIPARPAAGPPAAAPPAAPPPKLQQNYIDCYAELERYTIDFRNVGL